MMFLLVMYVVVLIFKFLPIKKAIARWYRVDFVNIAGFVKTDACFEYYLEHDITPISKLDFKLLYGNSINRFPRNKVIFFSHKRNTQNLSGRTVWNSMSNENSLVSSLWESKADHWCFLCLTLLLRGILCVACSMFRVYEIIFSEKGCFLCVF